MDAKKWGVIYEPEFFKYELKEKDKIIVLATDGLWEILSNEEVVEIVGECFNKEINCEETAEILVDKARKKFIDSNKENNELQMKNQNDQKENENKENSESKNKKKKNNKTEQKKEIKAIIDDITCIVIYLDIK